MKKYLLSAITIIAAGVLASCNQNDVENNSSDSKVEVKFSSNIVKVNTPKTKMSGNKWDKNDAIGIYMFESGTNIVVEEKSNIKYTTQSEGTIGSFTDAGNVIYFPDNGDKVCFMSYYPYTENIINNIYKVDVSNQSNQSLIDLLHSYTGTLYDKTVTGKKVSLLFDHELTKININVKVGTGLVDSDLDDIIVTIEEFNTKADFNLISGEIENPTTISSISPKKTNKVNDYVVSYESIVIPTNNPGVAHLKFDLNNSDGQNNDVFKWSFNGTTLLKGTEYTYNVTINRSGIVVEAEINNWGEGGNINIDAE